MNFDDKYFGEDYNRVDNAVEVDNSEGYTVTVGLLKQKNSCTMSKLFERCHDGDLLTTFLSFSLFETNFCNRIFL